MNTSSVSFTLTVIITLTITAIIPLAFSRISLWWVNSAITIFALTVVGILAVGSPESITGKIAGALTTILCITIAATGGMPLVPSIFRIARSQREIESHGTVDLEKLRFTTPRANTQGPLRGGRIIGILERLTVAICIISGWPEGIAIVLAVKGLARYPELRSPDACEQFIIGTFTSVLWAASASAICRQLLS
ncbi:MAG: hypothetical protein ACRCSF_00630 [Mycobacteriaceae bacterium]